MYLNKQMAGQTIIITGIPGVNIEKCLEKFVVYCKKEGKSVFVYHLDKEIESIFLGSRRVDNIGRVWEEEILITNYPKLHEIWNRAFKTISEKINQKRSENPEVTILLKIHACYFHEKHEEYITLIDFSQFALLDQKPAKIITLIDDIYEIYHRLIELGGCYYRARETGEKQMVFRLLHLLEWRAMEIVLSRNSANQLKLAHYAFATKHSLETFSKLIFDNRCNNKVYLSHPITEVRKLERNNRKDEAKKIMKEITEISEKLSLEYTTFLPTTIDELRIRFVGTIKEKKFLPALDKRWENELYNNPEKFLYIKSGFEDTNKLWKSSVDELEECKERTFLEVLANTIINQVTVRDYTLVGQSEILVMYRPLFNGSSSVGTQQEFDYYKQYRIDTNNDNLSFIYCPRCDIEQFCINQFEGRIKADVNFVSSGDKSTFKLSQKEVEILLIACENRDSIDFKKQILLVLHSALDNPSLNLSMKDRDISGPLSQNEIQSNKDDFVQIYVEKDLSVINAYEKTSAWFGAEVMTIDKLYYKINSLINK